MHSASTVAEITLHTPRDWFFYWFFACDLEKIMHRYSILPGIVGTREQTGPMHENGTTRILDFEDGTTARETIDRSTPPELVHYHISEITSPFRLLIRGGQAHLVFKQDGGESTTVEWHYTFFARSGFANLLLKPLVSGLWKRFLLGTLICARTLAEAEYAKAPADL